MISGVPMAAMPDTLVADAIGRFIVERELGRGAQGTVYLATDPRLQRKVAVKTLRAGRRSAMPPAELMRLLMDEARIVGQLQHPNIVTLYDAGEQEGLPYLVFEYVEGSPLSDLISDEGRIAPGDAAGMALQVLRGIAYAHERNVVHRDIKPGNIMITGERVARIMDFGIALRTNEGTSSGNGLSGTPRYMAPEYLKGGVYTPGCEVFAVGMVLYEMLTGTPAVRGSDPHAIMYAMVHQPFERPSARNSSVDERIEAIVMRALAKDPAQRYAGPDAMIEALAEYSRPASGARQAAGDDGDNAALEYVLRRMRHKTDFPALSSTIATVNRVAASDTESTSGLADSILKDVALTNKILRMVNAVAFSQFGGSISTISRAVSILGVRRVRSAALSLMLFEHLQNKSQAADMKDLVSASYFSGTLARDLASHAGLRFPEEVFICSMFHRLGKLLATFYLHEEASDIARLARTERIEEDDAAADVLGLTYTGLGAGVAEKWNLPERIVKSMVPFTEASVGVLHNDVQKLRAVSDLSNRLADVVRLPEGKERRRALQQLSTKYEKSLDLSVEALSGALERSAQAFAGEAQALSLSVGNGEFMQKLLGVAGTRGAATPAEAPYTTDVVLAETVMNVSPETGSISDSPAEARQSMLSAGISDITQALSGDYVLNDVLRIILETMYRAIGFKRVMLFTLDGATRRLKVRFGFGADAERMVKGGLSIPLDATRDVFALALAKGVDICIEDRDSGKMKSHVPDWYRNAVAARGFILFPVLINQRPLAMIYADADDGASMQFEKNELGMLKTLRDQAILAIRRKSA